MHAVTASQSGRTLAAVQSAGSESLHSRKRTIGGGLSRDIPSKMSTIPNYVSESIVTAYGDIIAP